MRWCFIAVLCTSLVCSVRSDGESDEPSLRILARSTVYNVGGTKAIFCKGQNLEEPIQWYSPSNKLIEERSTKNNRIYVERKNENNGGVLVPLIIQHIKIIDAGNWTCRSGNLSETRDFIVGEKVVIADRNVSLEGEEAKSIKLSCEANGYPPPVVAWYREVEDESEPGTKQLKNIKDLNEPKKYTIKADNTLEIKKLYHGDVGLYVCKVRQKALSHFTDKNVQLTVQHKPVLYNKQTQAPYSSNQKYKTEEVYAILNETKEIVCSAIANPPPIYRWFRRHNSYDDDPIVDPETVVTSEDGTSSTLYLRMYNESYYGEYKCSANNARGTESIIFHVMEGNKPEMPDSVGLVQTRHTELVYNVTCSACIFTSNGISPGPQNLTVIGYDFELAPVEEGYMTDWADDNMQKMHFEVKITEFNDTLFAVGPLPNGTKYHVRVASRNSAGLSEWLVLPDAETDAAARRTTTLLLIITALLFTDIY